MPTIAQGHRKGHSIIIRKHTDKRPQISKKPPQKKTGEEPKRPAFDEKLLQIVLHFLILPRFYF
jgi:hypothetical protein